MFCCSVVFSKHFNFYLVPNADSFFLVFCPCNYSLGIDVIIAWTELSVHLGGLIFSSLYLWYCWSLPDHVNKLLPSPETLNYKNIATFQSFADVIMTITTKKATTAHIIAAKYPRRNVMPWRVMVRCNSINPIDRTKTQSFVIWNILIRLTVYFDSFEQSTMMSRTVNHDV